MFMGKRFFLQDISYDKAIATIESIDNSDPWVKDDINGLKILKRCQDEFSFNYFLCAMALMGLYETYDLNFKPEH